VAGLCSQYSDLLWAEQTGDQVCGGCQDFPHSSRPALGPTQCPFNGYQVSFLGVKWMGRGVDHLLQPSSEVKERIEPYFYSPSRPSWHVLG